MAIKHPASHTHLIAADLHAEAAKHHYMAGVHHEAGDHEKAKEHATKAHEAGTKAHEHSTKAHTVKPSLPANSNEDFRPHHISIVQPSSVLLRADLRLSLSPESISPW